MCIGAPHISTPPAPVVPERQTPKEPRGTVRDQLTDKDRRRRGYAAMMFAGNTGLPTTTGGAASVTGV
jgi:hypothetical protein